jgi:lysophospholipase L1-like esterase
MKKSFSGVLSFVIALAALEIASRTGWTLLLNYGEATSDQEPWFVYSKELGWERKPGFDGKIEAVTRRFDGEGLLAGDREKISNRTQKKILFVGDSNTFGNDCPVEKTFVALVDSLLPNAVTINAGTAGYTSYQGKLILARMLKRFRPDAIVISFNYNDRRYVAPPDLPDGTEAFERMYDAAETDELIKALDRAFTFRMLRFTLRKIGLLHDVVAPPADVDSLSARVSPDDYRRNLRETIEMAKRATIPAYLMVLTDNPIHTAYLNKGREQLHRSQPDSAIESLKIQTHQTTLFTILARKYLKHAYVQLGKHEEAKRVGTIEKPVRSIHSGFPIYLDSEYAHILREVGRELNVDVIEAGDELNKRPSVYYDFCHFDTTGHRIIAELLVSHLRTILAGTNEPISTVASE